MPTKQMHISTFDMALAVHIVNALRDDDAEFIETVLRQNPDHLRDVVLALAVIAAGSLPEDDGIFTDLYELLDDVEASGQRCIRVPLTV